MANNTVNMTVKEIFELGIGIINDNTKIYIRDSEMHVLTHGNWFQDNILEYLSYAMESFTWQDDGEFFIDLKPVYRYNAYYYEIPERMAGKVIVKTFETEEEAHKYCNIVNSDEGYEDEIGSCHWLDWEEVEEDNYNGRNN